MEAFLYHIFSITKVLVFEYKDEPVAFKWIEDRNRRGDCMKLSWGIWLNVSKSLVQCEVTGIEGGQGTCLWE